jgi:hypothetical protein
LNILDAFDRDLARLQAFTTAAVVPLFTSFSALVVFEGIAFL